MEQSMAMEILEELLETHQSCFVVAIDILWYPLDRNDKELYTFVEFKHEIEWDPTLRLNVAPKLAKPPEGNFFPYLSLCHMTAVLHMRQENSNLSWYMNVDFALNGLEIQSAVSLEELFLRIDVFGNRSHRSLFSADVFTMIKPVALETLALFFECKCQESYNVLSNNCQSFASLLWKFLTGDSLTLSEAIKRRWHVDVPLPALKHRGEPARIFALIPTLMKLEVLDRAENIFVNPVSIAGGSFIWYRRKHKNWFWTPYQHQDGWINCNKDYVCSGYLKDLKLSNSNIAMIHYLRQVQPKGYPNAFEVPTPCDRCHIDTFDIYNFRPCDHHGYCRSCAVAVIGGVCRGSNLDPLYHGSDLAPLNNSSDLDPLGCARESCDVAIESVPPPSGSELAISSSTPKSVSRATGVCPVCFRSIESAVSRLDGRVLFAYQLQPQRALEVCKSQYFPNFLFSSAFVG